MPARTVNLLALQYPCRIVLSLGQRCVPGDSLATAHRRLCKITEPHQSIGPVRGAIVLAASTLIETLVAASVSGLTSRAAPCFANP